MVRLSFFILLIFPFLIQAQPPQYKEVVMRKHANGNPYVVLYFDSDTNELQKEKVYYSNGKVEWQGTYKNKVEDGLWEFYWENGNLKSQEYYSKGKENGTCVYFDSKGKKTKEAVWKNGKLINEVKY